MVEFGAVLHLILVGVACGCLVAKRTGSAYFPPRSSDWWLSVACWLSGLGPLTFHLAFSWGLLAVAWWLSGLGPLIFHLAYPARCRHLPRKDKGGVRWPADWVRAVMPQQRPIMVSDTVRKDDGCASGCRRCSYAESLNMSSHVFNCDDSTDLLN